jgi:hypothetical protein
MVEEQHVQTLARELQGCLDRESGVPSSPYNEAQREPTTQDALFNNKNIQERKAHWTGQNSPRFNQPLVSKQFFR